MGGILQLMIASVSLGANSFVMYIEDAGTALYTNTNTVGQAWLDANNDIYFTSSNDQYTPSITKVNSGGTFAWKKYYGQSSFYPYTPGAICLVVANTDIFMADTNTLTRLDINGNILWQKKPTGFSYSSGSNLYKYKSIAINRASGTLFNQITLLQANCFTSPYNTQFCNRLGFATYANTGVRSLSVVTGQSDSPVLYTNYVGPINGCPRSGINSIGDIVSPATLWSREIPNRLVNQYPMVPVLYTNNITSSVNRAVYAWDTTSTGHAYFSGVCSDQVLNGNASAATSVMYAIGTTYVASTSRYEMILFKLDAGGSTVTLQKRFYGGSNIGNTFGSDVVVDGSYVYTLSFGLNAISIVKWLASDLSIQWQRHFYVVNNNRNYISTSFYNYINSPFMDSPGLAISSTHVHFIAKGQGQAAPDATSRYYSNLVVKVPKDGTKTGTYTVTTNIMGSTTQVTYGVSDGVDSTTFFTSNTNITAAYSSTVTDNSINADDNKSWGSFTPANTTIINL